MMAHLDISSSFQEPAPKKQPLASKNGVVAKKGESSDDSESSDDESDEDEVSIYCHFIYVYGNCDQFFDILLISTCLLANEESCCQACTTEESCCKGIK